jgi:hypothetical protein
VQTKIPTAATGFSDTFRLEVISLLDNVLLVIDISVDKSPLRIVQNLKSKL